MPRHLLTLLLLTLPVALQAQVSLIQLRVGTGSGCSHASLQEAINAVPTSVPEGIHHIIHVSNAGNHDNLQLEILDRSVEIIGGYLTCTDTTPGPVPTVLSGNPAFNVPVMRITAADQVEQVVLRNLKISGGRGDEASGMVIEQQAQVELHAVTVEDNQGATFGGGIRITGAGARLDLHDGSKVRQNVSSQDGGGIHCSHGAELFLATSSAVQSNTAAFNGGGIALVGCTAHINSGGHGLGAAAYNVGFNTAGQGGGIFLSGLYTTRPTRLVLGKDIGAGDARAQIMGNQASSHGGGIFASGDSVSVEAFDSVFSSNQSGAQGGALALRSGAVATIKRTHRSCAPAPHCASFVGNTAASGGAIAVAWEAARAEVEGVWFKDNTATHDGSVYMALNGHAEIVSRNNVMVRNTGPSLISISPSAAAPNTATVTLHNDTIADTIDATTLISTHEHGVLKMGRSVIVPGVGVHVVGSYDGAPAAQMHCNVVAGHLGMADADVLTTLDADVGFVAPGLDDYRPLYNSDAVDHCPAQAGYPAHDHHLVPRPVDAALPDIHGPFDAGAYEWNTYLFWDGFESAD